MGGRGPGEGERKRPAVSRIKRKKKRLPGPPSYDPRRGLTFLPLLALPLPLHFLPALGGAEGAHCGR